MIKGRFFGVLFLLIFHLHQKQSLRRSHDACLLATQGRQNPLHIFRRFLMKPHFHQRSGENSDHMIEEPISSKGKRYGRAILVDVDGLDGANRGFFAPFDGAERPKIMGSGKLLK